MPYNGNSVDFDEPADQDLHIMYDHIKLIMVDSV